MPDGSISPSVFKCIEPLAETTNIINDFQSIRPPPHSSNAPVQNLQLCGLLSYQPKWCSLTVFLHVSVMFHRIVLCSSHKAPMVTYSVLKYHKENQEAGQEGMR